MPPHICTSALAVVIRCGWVCGHDMAVPALMKQFWQLL